MADPVVISEEGSSSCIESEIDEQKEMLENHTSTELYDMGKLEFKENKNYEVAAERFSMALEKKIKELGMEGKPHEDLRDFYLSFADALLSKEEEKNDLFEFLKTKKAAEPPTSDTENSVKSEEVTDEQLAFEMFEFARKSFELYIKNLEEKKEEIPKKEALNYSYVFIRLGDISLINHFFTEALNEYKKCVELREKYKLGDENLIAPLISVSQSYMFCGKRKDAVDNFERVKKILLDVRQKTTPLPENTNEKVIRDTYDDVQIQINDLLRQIEEEGEEGAEVGSQTRAKELVVTTKSDFDKSVLNKENSEVTKIHIAPAAEDEPLSKKRRIDLSQYKN